MNDLRQQLLDLLGPARAGRATAAPTPDDWPALHAMADQHRLLPHLHARLQRGELPHAPPAELAQVWEQAHRQSAFAALQRRARLHSLTAMLAGRGIPAVVLKGPWLAWYAYPAAAERPSRDIDLLVPQDRAVEAFALLENAGFAQDEPSSRPLEQVAREAKHMPPQVAADGCRVELHMHAWEPAGEMPWPMPPNDAVLLARAGPASPDDPCRYPAPADMLAHLVIHAAYSHRFNVGPLLLPDVDYLLQYRQPDWPAFWDRAEAGGYARGAAVVLALVDRWRVPGLITQCRPPVAAPASTVDAAEALLVQDISVRKGTGLLSDLADARRAGIGSLVGRIARRAAGGNRAQYGGDPQQAPGYVSWALARAGETVRQVLSSEARQDARRTSHVGEWLNG